MVKIIITLLLGLGFLLPSFGQKVHSQIFTYKGDEIVATIYAIDSLNRIFYHTPQAKDSLSLSIIPKNDVWAILDAKQNVTYLADRPLRQLDSVKKTYFSLGQKYPAYTGSDSLQTMADLYRFGYADAMNTSTNHVQATNWAFVAGLFGIIPVGTAITYLIASSPVPIPNLFISTNPYAHLAPYKLGFYAGAKKKKSRRVWRSYISGVGIAVGMFVLAVRP